MAHRPIRIYADFSSIDVQGRVWLLGDVDLQKHKDELADGVVVTLYEPGDFEVEGALVFDKCWRAIPHYDTIRYSDCKRLVEHIGETLSKVDVIEYHADAGDPAPTLFELQLWFGDRPVRMSSGANGQDLIVATTARQSESYAPFPDFVTCRDVSAEPHYTEIVGRALTAIEPRLLDRHFLTGASLRFGDAVIHVHVEVDELYLTWGREMPPFGSES